MEGLDTVPGRFIADAQDFLLRQMLRNINLLAAGVPPVSPALHDGRLRWFTHPQVLWSIADIWDHGGGQCGDYAAAVAAEYCYLLNRPAIPVLYRVKPGKIHAVVEDLNTGRWIDPSLTGGMRRHYA